MKYTPKGQSKRRIISLPIREHLQHGTSHNNFDAFAPPSPSNTDRQAIPTMPTTLFSSPPQDDARRTIENSVSPSPVSISRTCKRVRKRVTFRKCARVRLIPSSREMDKSFRQKAWWQRNELCKNMMKTCLFGRALRHGSAGIHSPSLSHLHEVRSFLLPSNLPAQQRALNSPAPPGEEESWLCALGQSSRGLEAYSIPELAETKKRDRKGVMKDVLREQKRQRYYGIRCEECLAMVAKGWSGRAAELARITALHDANAAQFVHDEDKASKSSSTFRPTKLMPRNKFVQESFGDFCAETQAHEQYHHHSFSQQHHDHQPNLYQEHQNYSESYHIPQNVVTPPSSPKRSGEEPLSNISTSYNYSSSFGYDAYYYNNSFRSHHEQQPHINSSPTPKRRAEVLHRLDNMDLSASDHLQIPN